MSLPVLPQDKANHVVAGCIAYVLTMLILAFFNPFLPISFNMVALIATAAVGFLKEVVDYVLEKQQISKGLPPTHDADPYDFLATFIGGLFCYLATLLM